MGEDRTKFLSKGGTILGIAAAAHANGISSWNSLGPALAHPSTRFLNELQHSDAVMEMTGAVMATMRQSVPHPLPSWIVQLAENPALRARIGDNLFFHWPPDTSTPAPNGEDGGRLALAIALCRNPDTAQAAAKLFDNEQSNNGDSLRFWDLTRVAAVLSPPGVPSQLRKQIKALLQNGEFTDGTR